MGEGDSCKTNRDLPGFCPSVESQNETGLLSDQTPYSGRNPSFPKTRPVLHLASLIFALQQSCQGPSFDSYAIKISWLAHCLRHPALLIAHRNRAQRRCRAQLSCEIFRIGWPGTPISARRFERAMPRGSTHGPRGMAVTNVENAKSPKSARLRVIPKTLNRC